MATKAQILKGRQAVDSYRASHTNLYTLGWRKTIPEEHTPLLETLLADLKKWKFNSLQEFFDASEELNILEVGGDALLLEGMWH